MSKDIVYKYIQASDIFNSKHKDYQIRVFNDLNFLHIYVDNLKTELTYDLTILNEKINDYNIDDIVNYYDMLVDKL